MTIKIYNTMLRQNARVDKNFVLEDQIRNKFKNMGIIFEDTSLGVKWKRI